MRRLLAAILVLASTGGMASADETYQYDVVIYGGTAGGVAAAIQAARMGQSVAIIEPTQHLGGMTTNGLSKTDTGNTNAIQGLAREFYLRVGQSYGFSTPEWTFEPKVAESVLNQMVTEAGITVYRGERLALSGGVVKQGTAIQSIRMESGRQFNAYVFVDSGYEGDLMAGAGVSYAIGREANATYGETYNGVQVGNATKHQFNRVVDPYVTPGVPSSGLLPGIRSGLPPAADGSADLRIQAYNYRLTVTKAADRLPWTAPANYNASQYELLRRYIATEGITSVAGKLLKIDALRNGKYDVNNQGPVSTDFIGMNYAYPDANYATRDQIAQAHRDYQQGLLYFLATDPGLPASIRTEMNSYGLTADEFTDNGGWSGQMYIREARRLIGEYVMTDRNCRGLTSPVDPIALASYTMDSHNAERYVNAGGAVRNEGDVQIGISTPYAVSYGAITPQEGEASNLLVTSAISASHIAYGSIRMEPVFMELGQAAGTAAVMAITGGTSVQDVNYAALQQRLIADGALVGWPNNPRACTVKADFNDFTPTISLQNQGGGTNLEGNWTGTGTENVVPGNLMTSVGGYLVDQSGTGSDGKVQGVYNARRQNYRALSGQMSGEVWFSLLVQNPDATAHAGLSFNAQNNADPATLTLANFLDLSGTSLSVTLGGTTTTGVVTGLATGTTHLILGKMTLGAGPDAFELWVDPTDLANLDAADFAVLDRDFFDALTCIGVLSWNPTGPAWSAKGGYVDALRLSNLPGAEGYQAVTGVVPEPATLALVFLGVAGLVARRRRR